MKRSPVWEKKERSRSPTPPKRLREAKMWSLGIMQFPINLLSLRLWALHEVETQGSYWTVPWLTVCEVHSASGQHVGPQQGEMQGLPPAKKDNKGNNSNPQISKLLWNINHPKPCLLNRAQYMSGRHIWDNTRLDFWCNLKKKWTLSIIGEEGEKQLLKLIFVSWTVFEISVSKVQNPRKKKWWELTLHVQYLRQKRHLKFNSKHGRLQASWELKEKEPQYA